MCGIGGWFARAGVEWRPSREFICDLIKGVENRGRDATGYGTLQDDGNLYVYKGPISAWKYTQEFVKDEQHPIGRVGIIHTRGANVGSPDQNENNHPVAYGDENRAVIVVHNGTVGNLDEAYDSLGVERVADVDSALFAAALGKLGPLAGLEFMTKKSCGAAAIAAIFDDGSLVLARDSAPIWIASPREGVLIWSSEAEPLRKLAEEQDNEFGLPFWKVHCLQDSYYRYWDAKGNTMGKGTFRLPTMFKSPTYLRDKTAATAQQITPAQTPAPMTELQKRMGFIKDKKEAEGLKQHDIEILKGDASDIRNAPANKFDMEKEYKIPCSWSGCWKKSLYRIHYAGRRWVPLCESHTNKWQKKGHDVVISSQHEMGRKMASVAFGGEKKAIVPDVPIL